MRRCGRRRQNLFIFSEEPFYISNHTSNASSNEEEKEEVVDGSRTTLTDILRKRCQTKADCKVGGRCKKPVHSLRIVFVKGHVSMSRSELILENENSLQK